MSTQPTQPEALRLADLIHCGDDKCQCSFNLAAAELRGLYALTEGTPATEGKPWGAFIEGRVFIGNPPEHVRKLAESEGWVIQWLYTFPQAVRRALTPERVKKIVCEAGYDSDDTPDPERAAFINGLRHGERHHGITGAAA